MRSNQQIELVRLLAFVAVVTVHTNSVGLFAQGEIATRIAWLLDEGLRFTVPVFFFISGYFWRPERTEIVPYIRKLFGKLILPFVFWAALYIVLDATQILYPVPADHSWKTYLTTPWTGSVAFQLWFLPALLVGSWIGLGLIKTAGLRIALWVTFALFLIGSILCTYIRPFGIDLPLGVYRNGIFFAPVFLVGGYAFAQMQALPSRATFLAIAIIGMILQMLEGYFIFGSYPRGHDMSLATLPLSFGVFGFFLQFHARESWVTGWGKEVFGAYLVHVLLLQLAVAHFAPVHNLGFTFAIILSVIALSLMISRLAKTNRFSRQVMP